jgi:hypothetical protein
MSSASNSRRGLGVSRPRRVFLDLTGPADRPGRGGCFLKAFSYFVGCGTNGGIDRLVRNQVGRHPIDFDSDVMCLWFIEQPPKQAGQKGGAASGKG